MRIVHDPVLADRLLKIQETAKTAGISKDRLSHMLNQIFGLRKLSVRLVPRLLTSDNRRNCKSTI